MIHLHESGPSDEQLRKYLVPGKSVLIANVWWTIKDRDLDKGTVRLEIADFARKDGSTGKPKSMSWSALTGAIKGGKYGVTMGDRSYGPKQDKAKRAALRARNGLRKTPGAKESIEEAGVDTQARETLVRVWVRAESDLDDVAHYAAMHSEDIDHYEHMPPHKAVIDFVSIDAAERFNRRHASVIEDVQEIDEAAGIPTAKELNDHLRKGGAVQVATHLRNTIYTKKHAGKFEQGSDGDLYLRRGKSRDALTMGGGKTLLVSIRKGWLKESVSEAQMVTPPASASVSKLGGKPVLWHWFASGANWVLLDRSHVAYTKDMYNDSERYRGVISQESGSKILFAFPTASGAKGFVDRSRMWVGESVDEGRFEPDPPERAPMFTMRFTASSKPEYNRVLSALRQDTAIAYAMPAGELSEPLTLRISIGVKNARIANSLIRAAIKRAGGTIDEGLVLEMSVVKGWKVSAQIGTEERPKRMALQSPDGTIYWYDKRGFRRSPVGVGPISRREYKEPPSKWGMPKEVVQMAHDKLAESLDEVGGERKMMLSLSPRTRKLNVQGGGTGSTLDKAFDKAGVPGGVRKRVTDKFDHWVRTQGRSAGRAAASGFVVRYDPSQKAVHIASSVGSKPIEFSYYDGTGEVDARMTKASSKSSTLALQDDTVYAVAELLSQNRGKRLKASDVQRFLGAKSVASVTAALARLTNAGQIKYDTTKRSYYMESETDLGAVAAEIASWQTLDEAGFQTRKKFKGFTVRRNRDTVFVDDETKKISYYLTLKHGEVHARGEAAAPTSSGKPIEKMPWPKDVTAFATQMVKSIGESLDEARKRKRYRDGERVRIVKRPGGFKEFVGATGRIVGSEKDGMEVLYRVSLDYPVDIPGVGKVRSDLWTADHLELDESVDEDRMDEVFLTAGVLLSLGAGALAGLGVVKAKRALQKAIRSGDEKAVNAAWKRLDTKDRERVEKYLKKVQAQMEDEDDPQHRTQDGRQHIAAMFGKGVRAAIDEGDGDVVAASMQALLTASDEALAEGDQLAADALATLAHALAGDDPDRAQDLLDLCVEQHGTYLENALGTSDLVLVAEDVTGCQTDEAAAGKARKFTFRDYMGNRFTLFVRADGGVSVAGPTGTPRRLLDFTDLNGTVVNAWTKTLAKKDDATVRREISKYLTFTESRDESVDEGYQHVHWKGSKSVRFKISMPGGKMKSVQGRTFGKYLAGHADNKRQEWRLTHIPTGLSLGSTQWDEKVARLAKSMEQRLGDKLDFATPSEAPDDVKQALQSAMKSLRESIDEEQRVRFSELSVGDRYAIPNMDLVYQKVSKNAYRRVNMTDKELVGRPTREQGHKEVIRMGPKAFRYGGLGAMHVKPENVPLGEARKRKPPGWRSATYKDQLSEKVCNACEHFDGKKDLCTKYQWPVTSDPDGRSCDDFERFVDESIDEASDRVLNKAVSQMNALISKTSNAKDRERYEEIADLLSRGKVSSAKHAANSLDSAPRDRMPDFVWFDVLGFSESIDEGVDLRCPNCGDNLGKDTENPKKAYCSNCGERNIRNPRGYRESVEEAKKPKSKQPIPRGLKPAILALGLTDKATSAAARWLATARDADDFEDMAAAQYGPRAGKVLRSVYAKFNPNGPGAKYWPKVKESVDEAQDDVYLIQNEDGYYWTGQAWTKDTTKAMQFDTEQQAMEVEADIPDTATDVVEMTRSATVSGFAHGGPGGGPPLNSKTNLKGKAKAPKPPADDGDVESGGGNVAESLLIPKDDLQRFLDVANRLRLPDDVAIEPVAEGYRVTLPKEQATALQEALDASLAS